MAVNFGDVYWRQLPDGNILIGGADPAGVGPFFPDAFPQLPSAALQRRAAVILRLRARPIPINQSSE